LRTESQEARLSRTLAERQKRGYSSRVKIELAAACMKSIPAGKIADY
jgi:hypothetical protein